MFGGHPLIENPDIRPVSYRNEDSAVITITITIFIGTKIYPEPTTVAFEASSLIELAVNKLKRYLPILISIALMRGSIVAIAAIRVRSIAVRLDYAT